MSVRLYKGDVLLSEPRIAKSQWEKAKGLMFSPQHDVLFHFPTEQRLKFHMVFVFYPIDIVFIDDDMRVVDLKRRFKPFTVYYSKVKSSTVLESFDGFIEEHGITIGDLLTLNHDGELAMPSYRPARARDHTPQTRMLHGTSLGKERVVRAASVDDREVKPSAVRARPKPAKKRKTTRTSKKSSAKKRASTKKTSPAKRTAPKTAAKRSSTRKTTKRTSSKTSSRKKPAAKTKAAPKRKSAVRKAAAKKPAARKKAASKKRAAKKTTRTSSKKR